MKTEPMTKSAMITICGRPNVGKSTLTNALVGEKIAIVSSKPQTTRNRITAIVSRGETQFVLMDTPGFHKPRTKLGDYMVNIVRESVADVDGVLLVVEPIPAIGPQEEALISRIEEQDLRLQWLPVGRCLVPPGGADRLHAAALAGDQQD